MALDPQKQDHLHRLPTELKCAVARLLTTLPDRKSLVLVNRAWADIALLVLWEIFNTGFAQSGQRNLLGLAHPKSNITKHVHYFRILTGQYRATQIICQPS
jgi:hypothetical protein